MTLAEAIKQRPKQVDPLPERDHFLFENVDWEFYEKTLEQLERAGQHARVTFDEGRMEIMTVSGWHEVIKKAIARLLEHYSFVADIPIMGLVESTCKAEEKQKGLEPDECYFILNKMCLDAEGYLDLRNGPPPDLAIEAEVSQTAIPKQPIYARRGVAELWRANFEGITVLGLKGEDYAPREGSTYFPKLDMKEFFRFVKIAMENQHQAVKEFDAFLRAGGPKQ
jgi:Uma2 family endonuclease